MLVKVKEIAQKQVEGIRKIHPDFDVSMKLNNQDIRDNDQIREAKIKAILKSDNYFKSNDPLMEDYIITHKEDEEDDETDKK